MLALRRILTPVDFSECSRAALEYAVAFARPIGAEVVALHVWMAPVYVSPTLAVQVAQSGDMTTLDNLARRDAEERMAGLAASVDHPGVQLTTRIEAGDPLSVVLELSHAFDLIIAGTHGRTGVSHLLLGSMAEKLARGAERPLLTVRCAEPDRPPVIGAPPVSRILAAVDFSSCSRLALEHAVQLQKRFGATLDILHAVTHVPIEGGELLVSSFTGDSRTPFKEWAKKRAEEEMRDLVATVQGAQGSEILLSLGEPGSTILEALAEGDYDLVVIGTHGRTGFVRLLLGSVAERVMRRAPCPVLTVREVLPRERASVQQPVPA